MKGCCNIQKQECSHLLFLWQQRTIVYHMHLDTALLKYIPQVEGGDSIQMKKEHTAHVSFTNTFHKTLNGAVLTVEGKGLLQGKHEAR